MVATREEVMPEAEVEEPVAVEGLVAIWVGMAASFRCCCPRRLGSYCNTCLGFDRHQPR